MNSPSCRGSALISKLQDACLLEVTLINEAGREEVGVKLHDTVRDVALWIAKHDFVVLAGSNVVASQIPLCSIWESAKRISLMHNRGIEAAPFFENLNSCPNLTTLLLPLSGLIQNVPKGFFNSMPALRVLDLSGTDLSEFPIEITSLTSLQYLCLSYNDITSLPVELGTLTNLRQLILSGTGFLTSIPREAISRLSRLQVLDMEGSGYEFGVDITCPLEMGLSDLANLCRLFEVHLPDLYCSWRLLGMIVASPVLRRSTRNIAITASCDACGDSVSPPPSGDTISEGIGRLSGLRRLELRGEPSDPVMADLQLYPISRLQNLVYLTVSHFKISINISSHGSEPLFPRLRELTIKCCDGCSELTCVGRLPCLEKLTITDCRGLREVLLLHEGGHDHLMITPFSKLTFVYLQNLPSLTSISMRPLPFPSLNWLIVLECPRLKRLPFGPQSGKNLAGIEGEEAWWDELEWKNHADQQSFSSKFEGLIWDDY